MILLTGFIAIVTVARITEILVDEDIFAPLRALFGIQNGMLVQGDNKIKNFIGGILYCYKCASVWVSGFIVGLYLISDTAFYIIAAWMVFSYFAIKFDLINEWLKSVIHRNLAL